MSHVIYNKLSTKILQARAQSVGCYIDNYKTESAAKAALTRLANKGLLGENLTKEDYAIAESSDFAINIEKKRMVRNSMTGEEVEESVNTPFSCSVASENYWQS